MASYQEHGETVDVFLPSCGEPLAVLDNTFRYVSTMDWRGPKTVYVLDDSARETVRDLADQYGFRYIVRPNPGQMKKAGNLTHALGVSPGDFIAVIDADFAVRPDSSTRPCPTSPTPRSASSRPPSTSTSPTGLLLHPALRGDPAGDLLPVHPARPGPLQGGDLRGTNLVYRRAAVVAAGGFARVPIGEDVHSGVKLWWAGYQTRYLPLCLAKGVAPNDFPSLANQQARWCRSSMLLMIEKHFQEAPFTWQQRAAFWAAFLYYMSSAALLLTGPFPTLTMLWFFPRISRITTCRCCRRSRRRLFVFPIEPRLAADHLPGMHDQLVLPHLRDLVRDPGPGRRVGPDGRIARRGQVPVTVNRILVHLDHVVLVFLWSGLAFRVSVRLARTGRRKFSAACSSTCSRPC